MKKQIFAGALALGMFLTGCGSSAAQDAPEQEKTEQKEQPTTKEIMIHTCEMGFQGVPFEYVLQCNEDGTIETLIVKSAFDTVKDDLSDGQKETVPTMLAYFAQDVFPDLDRDAEASKAAVNADGDYELVYPFDETADASGNTTGNTYEAFKTWFDEKGFLTDTGCN